MTWSQQVLMYAFGAVGFVVGFLIGTWFLGDPQGEGVLFTLHIVAAFTGAVAGVFASFAIRAGNYRKAAITAGGGVVGCLIVGVAMLLYRWIFG